MLFDGNDDDFAMLENKHALSVSSGDAGVVRFTQNNSGFTSLNLSDKMDYAVFVSKYDVYDKKEYAEGLSALEKNLIERIFREGDVFAAIRRINTLMLYTSFACVVIMIAVYVALCVINFIFGFIDDSRLINLRLLICYSILLGGITFVLKWIYDRATKRIEIIQYYI